MRPTVLIDFEDISTLGLGDGKLTPVFKHYTKKGIYIDADAIDYSRGSAIPHFAHSGTKAIETCYGAELCYAPIQMTFTSSHGFVKVWAGYSKPLDHHVDVVLSAFDALGSQVDQVTAVFNPSNTPVPIRTPLEVTSPTDQIKSVTVSLQVEKKPHITNSLAVDDVEFDFMDAVYKPLRYARWIDILNSVLINEGHSLFPMGPDDKRGMFEQLSPPVHDALMGLVLSQMMPLINDVESRRKIEHESLELVRKSVEQMLHSLNNS